MLSLTTDYVSGTGDPEPYLRHIAEAGFSHIHWCHQWNTDFLYTDPELEQIETWLREYGLQLLDLHASEGVEKRWVSPREYIRRAGVELVKNRIAMTARLGGHAIVMHVPAEPTAPEGDGETAFEAVQLFWSQLRRSLDDLEPFARAHHVVMALENLSSNLPVLDRIFAEYDSPFIGFCYDSGHANFNAQAGHVDHVERYRTRLAVLHLNDNDGTGDQHLLPFMGTVDWPRVVRFIADSAYPRGISMEVLLRNTGIEDEREFLRRAYAAGTRLAEMLERERAIKKSTAPR